MNKFFKFVKRVIAMTLSVAMIISLFQSDLLRSFADEAEIVETPSTPVLDFVTEGVEPIVSELDYPIVYVKNNKVILYENYTAGSLGAVYNGAQGEQIQLAKSYTYTVGKENVVLYQYTYQDFDGVMYTACKDYYMFISADDISFDVVEKPETSPEPTATPTPSVEPTETPIPSPEPTITPEPTETATPEEIPSGIILDTVPQGEIPVSKAPEAKYGTIKVEAIKLFKSPEYGADGIELNVNAGTMIELVTAYTFESNGQIVYRFDYNSETNSELFDAALSQYSGTPFIPAEYVNVGIGELAEKTVTDIDTGMSVTALIPATAELISEQKEVSELPENADTTGINDNALFYDLTLANGGAVYQATSALKVTFPQTNISIPVGAEYTAYHVSDVGEVDVIGKSIYTGSAIDVTVESLSYVGLSSVVTDEALPYKEAVFKNDTVTLYQNFTDGSSTVEVSITDKGKLVLEAAYDVDGTLMYIIYSYEGTDTNLDEYINGYENTHRIVKATDVEEYTAPSVSPTPTPVPTPDTTPVIPENPTLTEGAEVSIVDGTGASVTDAGLKVREGTKISLSAWTGLTDVGDETYQWQISSEETAGYWVNINGQKSKGLLMSLAMVNSMTVPSIRCKIITGGITKYSMAIPVTALKENAFTDDSSNVSVAGVLPIDATLTVSNKSLDDTGLNNGVYPMGEASLFNDVTLYRGGSTYQPEKGETVTVTFPESSVTSTGFAAGDAYHVYHIHDGVVDLSEIKYYNGGNVEMRFSNLSVVGISEATPAEKDLVEQHGAIISEETLSPYLTRYVKNDSVVLYDTPESSEAAHITTVTGCAGAEVEAWQKITYTDGFVAYRVSSTANTPTDLSSTLGAYPIISALDLSEEYTDEPIIINTCAICGKEMGAECVTPHVYCPECKDFDCGKTHEKPTTEKPITVPVIPTNPTLTEGADVSIVDAEGNAIIAETGFAIPEGTRTSLSAWSALEDSDNVTYQWQVRYDGENWTDIQGKTEKGLVISPSMVSSITDPAVRCTITSGDTVQYSAAISVTVHTPAATLAWNEFSSPAMFNVARMSNGMAPVENTPDTYSIVINYVFENGDIVADPYTATLAAGSNFSATVKHPVIQGYLPYKGNETETSTEIALDIKDIQADVTYTVTYEPTNVNYTVIYYYQNIDNDNYTEAGRVTKQGLTGSTVPAVGKEEYDGFYELLYEQPKIAADGSTIVEVYYDRIYYLMIFNLGEGGYGVEPIYDRYGAPIGDVGTPTRPGYTFNGWDKTIPSTMPVGGGRYTAQWTPQQTTYTVVYWKENADDSNYSYWGQESKTALSGSTVSGSDSIPTNITTTTVDGSNLNERPYFTYNTAKTDTNVVVKGDGSTVVNVYYYRNTYTVYFRGISGRCAIEEHTHGTNCNSYLDCLKSEHTHDESCTKVLTCTQDEHTHIDNCTDLTCTLPEHGEHIDACLICDKPVHESHTDDCCTITVHTHSATCCTLEEHTHSNDCCEYGGTGLLHWRHSDTCCEENLTAHTHGTGSCTCATPEHVHGGSSCTCDIEIHYHSEDQGCYSDVIHQHSDSCYGLTCGYVAHTHTDACHAYTCGGEQHEHTDICYRPCTKRVHTHNNNCTRNDDNNVIYVVTAKYEQTIGDIWPTAANFPNITFRGWEIDGVSATATSKRVNMTSDLCDTSDNLKYAEAVTGGSKRYLYYMFESFDQTSPANGNERILRNGVYYDKSELYYQEVNSSGNWNQKEIAGMAPVSNGVVTSGSNVFLYYNRNRSNLMYHNVTGVVKTVTSIMYEQPLVNYKDSSGNLLSAYVPSYPDTLEPGAYEFAGWYTTPECYEGTEFNFNTATMPNSDLTLYAKWVPVTRTVTFYLDKETMDKDGDPLGTRETPHGSLVYPRVDPPVNGDYTFVSWFYIDEDGKEKAFVFDTMVVTKDMDVYAKWSSNVLKEYIVYFKIQGTDTQIADPITGSTLAGETRTFDAKGGTELDPDYQEGYFPLVESHSMNLDINTPETPDTDANGTEWVEITDKDGNKKIVQSFTFWYVQKDAVPYNVYYVAETLKDGDTSKGSIVRDGKTYYIIADTYINSENRKAVVTEKFKQVSGYMPDAYQKRLVVDGSDGAVNEIIFYYSVDNTHAYYKITHYTQNTDGENWTEYAFSQAIGDIGKTYTASSLNIDGFTYDSSVDGTVVSGELTADGLELKLYYVRNSYPYKVRYLEKGSGVELAEHKTGTGLYGKVVSESAIEIANYVAVDPTSQTLTIKIEKNQDEAKLNIITFYYEEKTVTINYKVVGPDGCGTVNVATDDKDPGRTAEETLKVLTGEAQGSTAEANENYRFIGWYSDEKCTKLLSIDTEYVPKKEDTAWVDGTTYYAKFELDVADLIIEKVAGDGTVFDENDTFIFKVKELSGKFETEVVIVGEGSITIKDLPIGTYEVSEDTSWSYKYNLTHINGKVVNGTTSTEVILTGNDNVVTFTNTAKADKWLKSDAYVENIFADSKGQGSNADNTTQTN